MKMRVALATTFALVVPTLWGCASSSAPERESPFQQKCEALLEVLLKTPSTLKVVENFETDRQGDTKEVYVEYDAQNEYGAVVRSNFSCSFLADPKWWIEEDRGRFDARIMTDPIDPRILVPFKVSNDGEMSGGSKDDLTYS